MLHHGKEIGKLKDDHVHEDVAHNSRSRDNRIAKDGHKPVLRFLCEQSQTRQQEHYVQAMDLTVVFREASFHRNAQELDLLFVGYVEDTSLFIRVQIMNLLVMLMRWIEE